MTWYYSSDWMAVPLYPNPGSRIKMLRALDDIIRNLAVKRDTTDDELLKSIYTTLIPIYKSKAAALRRDIFLSEFIVD